MPQCSNAPYFRIAGHLGGRTHEFFGVVHYYDGALRIIRLPPNQSRSASHPHTLLPAPQDH
jgi:hypothetical protein